MAALVFAGTVKELRTWLKVLLLVEGDRPVREILMREEESRWGM